MISMFRLKYFMVLVMMMFAIGHHQSQAEDKDSAQNPSTANESSINLPGVHKISQEFDQKFVAIFNESNRKVAEISKKINDLNQNVVDQCKGQDKLSPGCKAVLGNQTDLQIKMFGIMFDLYEQGIKIMKAKKKEVAQ